LAEVEALAPAADEGAGEMSAPALSLEAAEEGFEINRLLYPLIARKRGRLLMMALSAPLYLPAFLTTPATAF